MFERFTERARKVMALSNQEVQRFNHDCIEPEHVLLGLIKEGGGVAAHILNDFGFNVEQIRTEVEMFRPRGPEMAIMGKIPLSDATKELICFAINAASELKHNYIGTEHLLLGLLELAKKDMAENVQKIFEKADLDTILMKTEILKLLGSGQEDVPPEDKVDDKAEAAAQPIRGAKPFKIVGNPVYEAIFEKEVQKFLTDKKIKILSVTQSSAYVVGEGLVTTYVILYEKLP